jgi:hypothetical protein
MAGHSASVAAPGRESATFTPLPPQRVLSVDNGSIFWSEGQTQRKETRVQVDAEWTLGGGDSAPARSTSRETHGRLGATRPAGAEGSQVESNFALVPHSAPPPAIDRAVALFDFQPGDTNGLAICKDDVVQVLEQGDEWMFCRRLDGRAVRARPGRLRGLSISHSISTLFGVFVWACRVLSSPKRRFPARSAGLRSRLSVEARCGPSWGGYAPFTFSTVNRVSMARFVRARRALNIPFRWFPARAVNGKLGNRRPTQGRSIGQVPPGFVAMGPGLARAATETLPNSASASQGTSGVWNPGGVVDSPPRLGEGCAVQVVQPRLLLENGIGGGAADDGDRSAHPSLGQVSGQTARDPRLPTQQLLAGPAIGQLAQERELLGPAADRPRLSEQQPRPGGLLGQGSNVEQRIQLQNGLQHALGHGPEHGDRTAQPSPRYRTNLASQQHPQVQPQPQRQPPRQSDIFLDQLEAGFPVLPTASQKSGGTLLPPPLPSAGWEQPLMAGAMAGAVPGAPRPWAPSVASLGSWQPPALKFGGAARAGSHARPFGILEILPVTENFK